MMNLKVVGQRIVCEESDIFASGQVSFATIQFDFSAEWDGLDKTVQFTQSGTTYNVHLGTSNSAVCYIPSEIGDGTIRVSVFGVETGGSVIATTVPLRLRVRRSGFTDGKDSVEPSPSFYAQLLEEIEEKVEAAGGISAETCSEMIAKALADYIKTEDLEEIIATVISPITEEEIDTICTE